MQIEQSESRWSIKAIFAVNTCSLTSDPKRQKRHRQRMRPSQNPFPKRMTPQLIYRGLPSVDDALFGPGDVSSTDSSADLESSSQMTPGMMGKTTTSVFGVSGTGSTFVYVFDRSASMKGRPLAAAKQQLKNSLGDLDKVHQFHIIFYNEAPRDFRFKGQTAKLVFADEEGKSAAITFVDTITAVGATRHMPAITMALGMRPDVIFFLTDADEPQLTELELRRIQRMNSGVNDQRHSIRRRAAE